MFQISTEENYEDGQIIFDEGSSGDWVYIIDAGAVELFKRVNEKRVVIEVLKPGDVFGELAFFARIPRTLSARAVGETSLGVIDRDVLSEEFNRLSGNFRMILRSLVLRLEKATEGAAQSTLRRKEPRVPKVIALSFKSSAGLVEAFSGDMSAEGMYIKTMKPLPKGERFDLKLKLPSAPEALKIGCEVSWSRSGAESSAQKPPGMGVKFVEINSADQQTLRKELIKSS